MESYEERTPLINNGFHHSMQSDAVSITTVSRSRRISHPRRTFCLLVLFDLLLTAVLWLFECGIQSNAQHTFFDILNSQVTEYEIDTSLFDVLILSACRFLFLEVTYAGIRIKHWWPIAVSTCVSSILVFGKIFLIFLTNHTPLNIPMTIVCLVFAFFITWAEVWYLDSKVLPEEEAISDMLAQQQNIAQHNNHNNFYNYGFHPNFRPTVAVSSKYYSPVASIDPIDLKDDHDLLTINEQEMVAQGKYAYQRLMTLYNDVSIWKFEQKKGLDEVFSYDDMQYGKTFKLVASVNYYSPKFIFENVLMKGEDLPKWNKSITSVKILRQIGSNTKVTCEISAPAAMGMISSRQFVTVRTASTPTCDDNSPCQYVSAGMSTELLDDEIQTDPSLVRGFNGPTGFILSDGDDDNSTKFVWILNTDIRGNISRGLVNRNLVSTMFNFVIALRKYLDDLSISVV